MRQRQQTMQDYNVTETWNPHIETTDHDALDLWLKSETIEKRQQEILVEVEQNGGETWSGGVHIRAGHPPLLWTV